MTAIPEDLRSTAIKTPNISAAVVCPDQETVLSAVKEAKDKNLINPTLIGDKNLIAETAIKLSLILKIIILSKQMTCKKVLQLPVKWQVKIK